jgi:hypothetical protein
VAVWPAVRSGAAPGRLPSVVPQVGASRAVVVALRGRVRARRLAGCRPGRVGRNGGPALPRGRVSPTPGAICAAVVAVPVQRGRRVLVRRAARPGCVAVPRLAVALVRAAGSAVVAVAPLGVPVLAAALVGVAVGAAGGSVPGAQFAEAVPPAASVAPLATRVPDVGPGAVAADCGAAGAPVLRLAVRGVGWHSAGTRGALPAVRRGRHGGPATPMPAATAGRRGAAGAWPVRPRGCALDSASPLQSPCPWARCPRC